MPIVYIPRPTIPLTSSPKIGMPNVVSARLLSKPPMGDELELGAVKRLFGSAIDGVSMSSTKSAIGHLLGDQVDLAGRHGGGIASADEPADLGRVLD